MGSQRVRHDWATFTYSVYGSTAHPGVHRETPVRRTGGQGMVSALPGFPGVGPWRIRCRYSTSTAQIWPAGRHTWPWIEVYTLWPFATTVSGCRAGFLPCLAISPLCWRVMPSLPCPLVHGQSHRQERVRRDLGSIKLKGRHWTVLNCQTPGWVVCWIPSRRFHLKASRPDMLKQLLCFQGN